MQKAIEFYNKKLFQKAKSCFLDELKITEKSSSHYSTILKYLIEIDKKINNDNITKYQSELIEYHFYKSEFTEIIQFESEKLNINSKVYIAKSMYALGMLEKFEHFSKNILEVCLERKLHSTTVEFCKWLQEKKKYSLLPLFAELMVYVEINHLVEIVNISSRIENLILKEWNKVTSKKKSQVEYIEQLINLCECVVEKDFILIKKIYELKIKKDSIKGEGNFTKEEIIKSIIMFQNEYKILALIVAQVNDQFIKLDLKTIILSKERIKKEDLEFCHESIKQFYSKKTRVIKIEKKEEKNLEIGTVTKPTVFTQLEREKIYKKYLEANNEEDKVFEIEAKAIIKHDPEASKEPYSLIVNFISLKLYDSALLLVEKMDKTTSSLYLSAQIYFLKEEYSLSIEHLNELLSNKLNENEYISCLYLKALNYEKQGKESEAQNQYSIIATMNPDYRSVKERMLG